MSTNEESKTYRMVIAEWVTLGGILLGSFYFLHTDIQSIKASMLSHEQRTDRLYEMFIDLIKERRG